MKQPKFVANTADGLHCLQACYIMTIDALLERTPSMAEAEIVSGFQSGLPTWQFRLLTSLADQGLWCVDAEPFETSDFLSDPVAAIHKQVGDSDVAEEIISLMDVELEVKNLRACIERPSEIAFMNVVPKLSDVQQVVQSGGVALCNLNAKALHGEEGYEGHMIVVDQVVAGESLRIEDPGPPPKGNSVVSIERFLSAWHYPTETMANVIGVFDSQEAWQTYIRLH